MSIWASLRKARESPLSGHQSYLLEGKTVNHVKGLWGRKARAGPSARQRHVADRMHASTSSQVAAGVRPSEHVVPQGRRSEALIISVAAIGTHNHSTVSIPFRLLILLSCLPFALPCPLLRSHLLAFPFPHVTRRLVVVLVK